MIVLFVAHVVNGPTPIEIPGAKNKNRFTTTPSFGYNRLSGGQTIRHIEVPAMPKKKKEKDDIPRLYVRKGATLKEIYAAAREQFTAADLQKYTEIEPMVPAEEVLAELEAIHREELAERRKKKRKK